MLDKVREVVDEFPPEETKSRFGNRSFKEFYDRVGELAGEWGEGVLRGCEAGGLLVGLEDREKVVREVMGYFCESWGNRTRIDYGSGHELNFICWM